jgi:hypothetical protein
MQISEQELLEMVREAIARHGAGAAVAEPSRLSQPPGARSHASHALLTLLPGGDADGQCLIEPAVKCNHCGYCLSLGH